MDTKTLFQLSAEMAEIEDALFANGGELTDELALALQETETSLARKADSYNGLLRSLAAQKELLKQEKERYAKLEKVAANAEKRIKEHICNTMGMFGIDKIEGDRCKISRSRSTAIEVDEESMTAPYIFALEEFRKTLPPYIQVPDLKVSKTAIKEFQKSEGILPSGAEVVENFSLRIR